MLIACRRALPAAIAAVLAVAAALVAAGPAPAAVTGAAVFYSPVPDDALTHGRTVLVFRTDAPLPTHAEGTVRPGARIGRYRGAGIDVISRERHCYVADADVSPGRRATGLPGDRVRVRVRGVLDRRFRVRRMSARLARGAAFGCDADRKSTTALFDLFFNPKVEPSRVFLTANSGPYLRDLTWTGWGTERAVGSGTFVSDCASCGPKEVVPAQLVLSKTMACKGWGLRVYRRVVLKRTLPDGTPKRSPLGPDDAACG